jgi:hypothetical protein
MGRARATCGKVCRGVSYGDVRKCVGRRAGRGGVGSDGSDGSDRSDGVDTLPSLEGAKRSECTPKKCGRTFQLPPPTPVIARSGREGGTVRSATSYRHAAGRDSLALNKRRGNHEDLAPTILPRVIPSAARKLMAPSTPGSTPHPLPRCVILSAAKNPGKEVPRTKGFFAALRMTRGWGVWSRTQGRQSYEIPRCARNDTKAEGHGGSRQPGHLRGHS